MRKRKRVGEKKSLYVLKLRSTHEVVQIYGVEHRDEDTLFLCFIKGKWTWLSSSEFEPVAWESKLD